MADELPIYPDFRRAHRFPGLDAAGQLDLGPAIADFDRILSERAGTETPETVRSSMKQPGKDGLLGIHRSLYAPREGAGRFRSAAVAGVFGGQDCPDPEFIDRALDNFERWLAADSFSEIHPIEQAALVITRLVDIWPFDFGNRTSAMVFGSFFLMRSGLPPFAVSPDREDALTEALAAAIRMQSEPLVGAIYQAALRYVETSRER